MHATQTKTILLVIAYFLSFSSDLHGFEDSGQFNTRGTENSTFRTPARELGLVLAVESDAFVRNGTNTATEFASLDASFASVLFPLSLLIELLLIELVRELNDCLSWFDAVTTFTALILVPTEQEEEELSLDFACLDFCEPDEGPLVLSLGLLETPGL